MTIELDCGFCMFIFVLFWILFFIHFKCNLLQFISVQFYLIILSTFLCYLIYFILFLIVSTLTKRRCAAK